MLICKPLGVAPTLALAVIDASAPVTTDSWGVLWISEVIAMYPFVVLKQLVRHHADVCLSIVDMKIFVKYDVILGSHKLSPWVENKGYIAGVVFRFGGHKFPCGCWVHGRTSELIFHLVVLLRA
jgi:hypothetical protein